MTVRFFLVILFSNLLTGCGSTLDVLSESLGGLSDYVLEQDNSEPPAELLELTPEIKVNIVWQNSAGVGSDEMYLKLVPAVMDDKIIVADRNGLVQARDLTTGDTIWEAETELKISAGPGLGYNTVLVGTSDAEIVALNIADGSIRWTVGVSSEVLSIPQLRRNVVVVRTVDGKLTGLEEGSGRELWVYERSVPALSLRGTGTPVIEGDRVIEGYASGKLIAVRLNDGKVEWEGSVAVPEGRSELERMVDLDADPIVINDVIFIASFQGGVFAVALEDGQVLWRRKELSSYAGLSGDWRYLYVSDEAGDVWALDQRNGAALWKQTELHRRKLSGPVVYKDYLVVGDFEGYLHWLSPYDGRQLARIQIGEDPIAATPVVHNEVLYVYSEGGDLAAVTVE